MAAIVSREVAAQVQREQVRMLVLLGELQRALRNQPQLDDLADQLRKTMTRHVHLVDGVLDVRRRSVADAKAAATSRRRRTRKALWRSLSLQRVI